jgi:hypothetical protein
MKLLMKLRETIDVVQIKSSTFHALHKTHKNGERYGKHTKTNPFNAHAQQLLLEKRFIVKETLFALKKNYFTFCDLYI